MSNLPTAIADFMDDHDIKGLQIGSQTITAQQLRDEGKPASISDLNELWAAAHVGHRFKRPNGRTIYLLTGYRWDTFGYRHILQGEVLTYTLDGHPLNPPAGVAINDLRKMEVVQ